MNLYSNVELINNFSILIINDWPSRGVLLLFLSSSIDFDVDFSLINNEMKGVHGKSGNEGKRQVNIVSLLSVNRIGNDIEE